MTGTGKASSPSDAAFDHLPGHRVARGALARKFFSASFQVGKARLLELQSGALGCRSARLDQPPESLLSMQVGQLSMRPSDQIVRLNQPVGEGVVQPPRLLAARHHRVAILATAAALDRHLQLRQAILHPDGELALRGPGSEQQQRGQLASPVRGRERGPLVCDRDQRDVGRSPPDTSRLPAACGT